MRDVEIDCKMANNSCNADSGLSTHSFILESQMDASPHLLVSIRFLF